MSTHTTQASPDPEGFSGTTGHPIEFKAGTQLIFTLTSRAGNCQNLRILGPNGTSVVVDTIARSIDGKNVSTGFVTVLQNGMYTIYFVESAFVKFKTFHIIKFGQIILSTASFAPSKEADLEEDTRQHGDMLLGDKFHYGDTIANLVWFQSDSKP